MIKASTALALPLLLAATACHGGRPHHPGKMAGITDVIAVQGIGEVKARPDVARLTLGVEAQDPSASAAVESMTARMRAVIDAMKARGIAEADIQTSQLSIYSEQPPQPYPPQPYPQPAPMAEPRAAAGSKSAPVAVAVAAPPPLPVPMITYRVTNTVTVTVRKVETLGDVIGAAVGAGANHAGGIQFDVEDKKPLEDQARTKAMTDAKHRAEELARLGGVKLGPVLSVAEGDAGGDGPMPMYAAKMANVEASYSVPTEGGQITARHGVRVVYRIER